MIDHTDEKAEIIPRYIIEADLKKLQDDKEKPEEMERITNEIIQLVLEAEKNQEIPPLLPLVRVSNFPDESCYLEPKFMELEESFPTPVPGKTFAKILHQVIEGLKKEKLKAFHFYESPIKDPKNILFHAYSDNGNEETQNVDLHVLEGWGREIGFLEKMAKVVTDRLRICLKKLLEKDES